MAGTINDPETHSLIRSKSVPGLTLPVYGLGTWGLGGTFQADFSEDDHCVEAIQKALDAGVSHIDTAEMYGAGHTEELIGRAIQGRSRSDLIIASKALAHHLGYEALIEAAENSIARMDCDYLDLFMVHHPSDEIPISETMRGMDELVRRGLIRAIGVANFTKERLRDAQRHTRNRIVANQVHYSLSVRQPEWTGLLDFCTREQILVIAWQPIDRGIYRANSSPALARIAQQRQLTPVQIALSWVTSQPGIVALCRTLNSEHLHENLAAADTILKSDEIEMLRRDFQPQVEKSDVYPLR